MSSHSPIGDRHPHYLDAPIDILVLSNGPGEVSTWVRPVVQALRQQLGHDRQQIRISLILSPCPNASGREVAIAQRYPEIDRIQSAKHFFPFLLWGKTSEQWDWRDRGMVVFLGGDQLFPILIGKRLGYRTLIYGEWDTRWHQWGDRYAAMNERLVDQAPQRYRHKFTVVGDLMADIASIPSPQPTPNPFQEEEGFGSKSKIQASTSSATVPTSKIQIALLPGSKPAKLGLGVPFVLAIAAHVHAQNPNISFVIPVAPTLDLQTLETYAQSQTNPWCEVIGSPSVTLEQPIKPTESSSQVVSEFAPHFKLQDTNQQVFSVKLHTDFPAYEVLQHCRLAITTVGANTAELGALAIPMIVILPTQQMDAMRAWDGLPGLLANLPGVGTLVATVINLWFLRKKRLLAWPNIWAKEEIVPELVGRLDPKTVAAKVLDYLEHPQSLETMRYQLRAVRGDAGAGDRIAHMIKAELSTVPSVEKT